MSRSERDPGRREKGDGRREREQEKRSQRNPAVNELVSCDKTCLKDWDNIRSIFRLPIR